MLNRRDNSVRLPITALACAATLAVILGTAVAGAALRSRSDDMATPAAAEGRSSTAAIAPNDLERVLQTKGAEGFSGLTPDLSAGVLDVADADGSSLSAQDFDRASSATMTFVDSDRYFVLDLRYAPSEFEGDKDSNCKAGLEMGMYLQCEVLSRGDKPVVSKVKAASVGPSGIPSKFLISAEDANKRAPDYAFFYMYTVQVFNPGGQITSATQYVRGGTLAEALASFDKSHDALAALASDEELVLDEPPRDDCGYWVKPDTGSTCVKID